MAKNDNLKDFVTDIADAIREKKGTTDLINPQDFSNEIRSLETGGEVIKVDSLPDTNVENDKFYIVEELLLYIIDVDNGFSDYLIFENPPIYVDSINSVSNPIFGGNVPQIYVDKTDYIGYIFTSETDKITLAEMLNLQAGMQFINGGKISQVEDATQSGIYFVPSAEAQTVGIPDSNYNKKVYKYNGFNWEYLGLNKYDVAGKWQEISSGNIYEFKIDGGILVNDEYNYLADNYKIIDNKVYIFDMDGNQSEPLLYIKSENSTNLARLDNKNFIYNKIEDFKVDEKTLDYDQASGIWYASSLDGNGRVESIMYYVLPLLQDENGKRNVKVYSADAEGFYDSTTPGMTYRIDGNQIKLEMESNGEVSDAGTFGYEVINNKVHLTMDGEVFLTKIVTGLGKNDNGQFVSNYIPQNGLYNGVTINDPEALFFSAVIDVSGSSGGGSVGVIETAELPNVSLSIKDSAGTIIETRNTGANGGVVSFNVSNYDTYTITATATNGVELWNNNVIVDKFGLYACKTGKALNSYTWEEINTASVGGYAKYMWSVGDSKTYVSTGSIFNNYEFLIIGFGHDTLASDGVSKAGITFMMKKYYSGSSYNINLKFYLNGSSTYKNIGGYRSSLMRQRSLPQGSEIYSQASGVTADLLASGFKYADGTSCPLYSYNERTDTYTEATSETFSTSKVYHIKGYYKELGQIEAADFVKGKYFIYSTNGYTVPSAWTSGQTYYAIYQTLQEDGVFYNALSEIVQYIKPIKKTQSTGNKQTSLCTTEEKIWHLAAEEVHGINKDTKLLSGYVGANISAYNAAGEGLIYDYFKNKYELTKIAFGAGANWWLRSFYTSSDNACIYISSSGYLSAPNVSSENRIRPCFCI